jgi:CRP-like cAMP-binding protein
MKEFEKIMGPGFVRTTTPVPASNEGPDRRSFPGLMEWKSDCGDRRIPFNGLLSNKLIGSLPGADCARLLPHLEPVLLTANQTIYNIGDKINFAYFPETAVLTHLYFFEDGSTTAAALVGNEGMIGLSAILDSAPQAYATQVTIAGNAMRIEVGALKEEFARAQSLQQALLCYASIRLAQLSQKAVCNGRHRLDERFCTWLLMVSDRAGQNRLRLTHEQIAHYLGSRRAGITDACNTLRSQGIIYYRRGAIRIINRELLEQAACECYAVLNHPKRANGAAGTHK